MISERRSLVLKDEKGETFGIFGPVITRVPDKRQSLELWDSVVLLTTTPGFGNLNARGPNYNLEKDHEINL